MCCEPTEQWEKLDAEFISSNEQLLCFDLRSRDINWRDHVVPLQARGAAVYLQRQFNGVNGYRQPIGGYNKRELLVCHDMMGNYLDDRFYNCSKKYDSYRFYHWAAVDYFCYFSHHYITIPPCGWVNAAHKHGVRVLGTFITESDSGSERLHEMLQTRDMVDLVVEALMQLCLHFCFEGWLINIECPVERSAMENMFYFVEQLRLAVAKNVNAGVVFWYDSIIDSGQLSWQNEVNSKNVRFFDASDATLMNYCWKTENLVNTRRLCLDKREFDYQRVFAGIDVFGRGQLAKFQTRTTLEHIVKNGFSAGIFAPAWTFETLLKYGYDIKEPLGRDSVNDAFLLRNEKFWHSLWDLLATYPYVSLPFETNFCLGSGKSHFENGVVVEGNDDGRFFNLSRQSLQPSVPLHGFAERYYGDAYSGGSCLRIVRSDEVFRLFATDFKFRHRGLVFGYAYKVDEADSDFGCVLRICESNDSRDCYLYLGSYPHSVGVKRGQCSISPFATKYNDLLSKLLNSSNRVCTLEGDGTNDWHVRFYVAAFDVPIQVVDIGVLFQRRNATGHGDAFLGAVFLDEFDIDIHQFPEDSNTATLHICGNDFFN